VTEVRLGIAPGVEVVFGGLQSRSSTTRLSDLPLIEALSAGAALEELLEVGTPRAGHDVMGVLDVLHRRCLLAWEVISDAGERWATVYPRRRGVPLVPPGIPADAARLSRFALLRREGDMWLLESGRSPFQGRLSDAAAAALAHPGGDSGSRDERTLSAVLRAAGLLADSDDDGPSRYWEFHDRYFATHSRADFEPYGGTFRFAGTHDPEPLLVPGATGERLDLPVPDPADPGPALWQVVEARRTIRDVTDDPVPLTALGSLLWHTLRLGGIRPRDPATPESYDAGFRPVPSGGATHSVGLWLWCERLEGVPRGAWWYDPEAHALVRVEGADEPLPHLGDEVYPVLGSLVSRHARIAWKYERIAHTVALKDAGVILHALQIGALALGLAMCPLGSGPTAPLLEQLLLDPDEYTPVGEFWLGVPSG